MASLPAPSVLFDTTSCQPGYGLERHSAPSSGVEAIYFSDKWATGDMSPRALEVLFVPTGTFSSSLCKGISRKSKDDFWASFLEWSSASPKLNLNLLRDISHSWQPRKQQPVGGWFGKIDKIITELGRLKSGWDGDVANPPSQILLNQMEQALQALPQDTREPEVEIDPTDGSVVTRWWSEDSKSAFSMTFTGNGKVYAVTSSMSEAVPASWECDVHDETKIEDRISHPVVRKVLAETA